MLVVGVAFRNAEVVVFHSKALELARASHAPRGERAAFESQNERPRAMSVVSGAHVTAAGAARRLELTNSDGARARTRIAHGARRTRRARVAERAADVRRERCMLCRRSRSPSDGVFTAAVVRALERYACGKWATEDDASVTCALGQRELAVRRGEGRSIEPRCTPKPFEGKGTQST